MWPEDREIVRQVIFAMLFDANLPAMVIGEEIETAILLLLDGQETKAKH